MVFDALFDTNKNHARPEENTEDFQVEDRCK
jgi:hypothetical protein